MTFTAPDGAYTIGGGQWNYGQTMSESVGKSMFEMDRPTPENMLDLLRISLTKLPMDALKPFQGFLGLADELFDNVENAVNSIIDAVGVRPLAEWVIELFTKLAGVFTGDIDGFVNWFQQSILQIFSWLPLSHLFPKPVNLLKLTNFDAEADLSETDGWEWDGTTTASSDGTGSAKVTCDGSTKFLVRDQVIFVEPKTKLNLQARVKSSGLTGSNAKIELTLVEFNGDAMGDIVTVASRGPSTSWATFAGEYTVPEGIKSVRVRLAVTQATGGIVWFDNLNLYRSGLLQMDWIEGLNDALGGAGDWFQNFVDGLLEALYGTPIIGGAIEAVFEGIGDLVNDVEGVIGDLADLVWGLLNNAAEFLSEIPQTLVAGLTSALGAIGTQAVNAWNDLTILGTNLATNAAAVVGSIVNVVVDGVATMGQFLTQLWEGLTGGTSTAARSVADVKSGGGSLLLIANGAQGTADTAVGAASAAQSTANNAEAQSVANAAELAKLTATNLGIGNSGAYDYDNFDYTTTSGVDNTRWDMGSSGTGYLRVDGSKVYWVDNGSGNGSWICRYNKTETVTPYQVVTVVLDSPVVEAPLLGSPECFNYVVGRLDSSWTNYVYAKIGYNTLSVWKKVGGTEVMIGSAVSYSAKPGDTIQFQCGNPSTSDIRQFVVRVNGSPVVTVTDSTSYGGVLSVEGAANLSAGMAFYASPRFGGQSTPGAVSIFSLSDNKAPAMVGSYLRATKGGGSANLNSGNNFFPTGWFGSADKTPDLSYNSDTGRVTVTHDGTYQVEISQYGSTPVGGTAGGTLRVLLYKNGSVAQQRQAGVWNASVGFPGFSGSFLIYLKAGDYIEPGYYSGQAANGPNWLAGDATQTYMTVALVNRSYT